MKIISFISIMIFNVFFSPLHAENNGLKLIKRNNSNAREYSTKISFVQIQKLLNDVNQKQMVSLEVDGDRVGNGGDTLVCEEDGEIVHYFFDYRMAYDLGMKPVFEGETSVEKLDNALLRLAEFSPRLAQRIARRIELILDDIEVYYQYADRYKNAPTRKAQIDLLAYGLNRATKNTQFQDGTLIDIPDSAHKYEPEGCKLHQLVIQRVEPQNKELKEYNYHHYADGSTNSQVHYLITLTYLNPLIPDEKSEFYEDQLVSMILHEGIYGELVKNYGHTNSVATRSLFTLIASDKLKEIKEFSLADQIKVYEKLNISSNITDFSFLGYHFMNINQIKIDDYGLVSGKLFTPRKILIENIAFAINGFVEIKDGRFAIGHVAGVYSENEIITLKNKTLFFNDVKLTLSQNKVSFIRVNKTNQLVYFLGNGKFINSDFDVRFKKSMSFYGNYKPEEIEFPEGTIFTLFGKTLPAESLESISFHENGNIKVLNFKKDKYFILKIMGKDLQVTYLSLDKNKNIIYAEVGKKVSKINFGLNKNIPVSAMIFKNNMLSLVKLDDWTKLRIGKDRFNSTKLAFKGCVTLYSDGKVKKGTLGVKKVDGHSLETTSGKYEYFESSYTYSYRGKFPFTWTVKKYYYQDYKVEFTNDGLLILDRK